MQSLHDKAQEAAFNDDVIRSGREILLQGFNWESHKHDWWDNLEKKVPDLAKFGFTSIWLPPTTQAVSPEGYLPQNLYSLNSCYGYEKQLKALLQKLCQHKVRSMADIVINHRVGTTQGQGGAFNCFDGIPIPWDEHAITSCSGGLGSLDAPVEVLPCGLEVMGLSPRSSLLQKCMEKGGGWQAAESGFLPLTVRTPLRELAPLLSIALSLLASRIDLLFARTVFTAPVRYDAKFVKMYVEQSKPIFSVGEYWDSCSYNSSNHADIFVPSFGVALRLTVKWGPRLKTPALTVGAPAVPFYENHEAATFPQDKWEQIQSDLIAVQGLESEEEFSVEDKLKELIDMVSYTEPSKTNLFKSLPGWNLPLPKL
ncbi:putative alpha-amylase 2 [Platanthera guangdongensis]|uniref:1,4-alpha-D-glucan glucanohydrolase n=1 Tax=Platanthera guangdongensis TaxID=2320717 RepID=A0ABR2LMR0_9ASPA